MLQTNTAAKMSSTKKLHQVTRRHRVLFARPQQLRLRNHPGGRCIETKGMTIGAQHRLLANNRIAAFANFVGGRRCRDFHRLFFSGF